MDKEKALEVIIKCAKLYKENLEGKNLLFVSTNSPNKFNLLEVKFTKSNYQHLTGVTTDNSISPTLFYTLCLKSRLSINRFEFKTDGTTPLKLSVLPQLMEIYKNANMIGDYNGIQPKLYSDKIAGNIRGCMGLIKAGNYYAPETSLEGDIRNLIKNKERVIAVFSKCISDPLYTELEYLAKGFKSVFEFPIKNWKKIDLENLVCNYNPSFVVRPIAVKESEEADKEIASGIIKEKPIIKQELGNNKEK